MEKKEVKKKSGKRKLCFYETEWNEKWGEKHNGLIKEKRIKRILRLIFLGKP